MMTVQQTTRNAAKAAGSSRYFSGLTCANGHIAERQTTNGNCVLCIRQRAALPDARKRQAAYRAANSEAIKKSQKEHTAKNRAKKSAYDAVYRAANIAKKLALDRAYYWSDPEKHRAAAKAWHRKNREHALAYKAIWRATNGERWKPYKRTWYLLHKARIANRKKHRYFANHQAELAKMAAYRDANRERLRASLRAYFKAHPEVMRAHTAIRRARKKGAGGTHTVADIVALMTSQNGQCVYCSGDIRSSYHVDHRMPLCLGGSNWPENLQLTCRPCNLRKGRKHPEVFELEIAHRCGWERDLLEPKGRADLFKEHAGAAFL